MDRRLNPISQKNMCPISQHSSAAMGRLMVSKEIAGKEGCVCLQLRHGPNTLKQVNRLMYPVCSPTGPLLLPILHKYPNPKEWTAYHWRLHSSIKAYRKKDRYM